jgi:hypothetical protein
MNLLRKFFGKVNEGTFTDVALLVAIFVMAVIYKMIKLQAF